MVQKGKFSAAIFDAVRALNRVDLPTLGKPTIPHFKDISCSVCLRQSSNPLEIRIP